MLYLDVESMKHCNDQKLPTLELGGGDLISTLNKNGKLLIFRTEINWQLHMTPPKEEPNSIAVSELLIARKQMLMHTTSSRDPPAELIIWTVGRIYSIASVVIVLQRDDKFRKTIVWVNL